ncbi:MAG: PAS domain-containing protein [Bdellovibrionales bacterium]|nr:PAS domain-containing protein [Bdellovibrionales bacterium]
MSSKAESSRIHSALIKGITDAAFAMKPDQTIEEYNRFFVKLHNIDSKDMRRIKTSSCRDFVDLEICETNCILKKVLEVKDTVRFDEVKGRSKQGEELTLIVTALPIKGENDEIKGIIELHRDVSDEAKIHSKYKVLLDKEKRAKEELEKLVDARTSQLKKANEDLKTAEAHLVHSEKMSSLGQMVAGIAHELNNPINFISGNVDVLEEYVEDIKSVIQALSKPENYPITNDWWNKLKETHDLDYKIDDLKSISSSIRKGSERSTEVIQGLRTFSRLDEAQLKETDIHQDIDTTLMLLRNQYKDRIEIIKEYGAIEPFRCFSSQLNQVYMNLLQNAIHAIKGKGKIWIRTRLTDSHLEIEFQDNGSGMSEETKAKIFDPFFTTKAVGEGTGLGLSVTYGIIQKHQGSIHVESSLGKGTKFTVSIPKTIVVNL